MRRLPVFVLICGGLLLAAVLGGAGSADAKKKCKEKVYSYGGAQARKFCGPARARVTLPSGTKVRFKRGHCDKTDHNFTINIGTIVIGDSSKKRPKYFGITVDPAPKDGTYHENATVSFVRKNKGYGVGDATVTLKKHRSRGTFHGKLFSGGKGSVHGSFRCK
jgi:hypothetical protein